ncbi:MAG: glutamate--tRNA ligase [Planctomycetes bacterium]|nr:glutamate--tRNA ligase [Planctomycetota bacterium]
MPPRVRIAPSPTGDPHVGTAYVALFNYAFARRHGGSFVLRIEDTDRARSTRASEEAIYQALRWLGLEWDEGPDVGGPHAPYRQSERSAIYARHAAELLRKGAAYRCFCTAARLAELRERQKREKQNFGYDGLCRSLAGGEAEQRAAQGEPCVVRLRVPEGGSTTVPDLLRKPVVIAHAEIDDQILLKSDGHPTYHLANVVDDHLMGITHVLRAEEWIPSTPKHVLLYQAFGWEMPVFCHLPLLRNKDRSKISKRKNPTSLDWYRDGGFLPEALCNFLSLMGWNPKDGSEVFGLERFLAEFEPEAINTTSPVFDLDKLEWLNGEYIRALAPAALAARLQAFLRRDLDAERLARIVPLIRERLKTLARFDETAGFFYAAELPLERALFQAARGLSDADRATALAVALALIEGAPAIEPQSLEAALRDLARARGWSAGDLFMCLRIALTGKTATPPLIESMAVLGRETCSKRVRAALELLAR